MTVKMSNETVDVKDLTEGCDVKTEMASGTVVSTGEINGVHFALFKESRPSTEWDYHYYRIEQDGEGKPVVYKIKDTIESTRSKVSFKEKMNLKSFC